MEPSSTDIVISICKSPEFPSDQLLGGISRVLKPGGTIIVYNNLVDEAGLNKVNICDLEDRIMVLLVYIYIFFPFKTSNEDFLAGTLCSSAEVVIGWVCRSIKPIFWGELILIEYVLNYIFPCPLL